MSKTHSPDNAAVLTIDGSLLLQQGATTQPQLDPTTNSKNDDDDEDAGPTALAVGAGNSRDFKPELSQDGDKSSTGRYQSSSSTATLATTGTTKVLVSPVISRDYGAVGKGDAVTDSSSKRTQAGYPENNEKIQVVQVDTLPVTNPRLKALKNLVRSNSEPSPVSKNPEIDLEKGVDPAAAGTSKLGAGGNLSDPNALKQPTRLAALLEPNKPLRPPPTYKTSFWNIVKYSWLNVMLIFVPVAFGVANSGVNDTAIFCCAFAAIIPLAALLGFATEELALRVGPTLGGLMNATLGNTVELIIAILALVKGELRVVQSAMIGSILSNCLLVLGCCFFVGGIRFHEQIYTVRSAQLHIGMLGISALVIVIPAAFHIAVEDLGSAQVSMAEGDILKISRGVAFILLFVYAAYLFFQLWTHAYLYSAKQTIAKRSLHRTRTVLEEDEPQPPVEQSVLRIRRWRTHSSDDESDSDLVRTSTNTTASSASTASTDDEDGETPKICVGAGIILIVIVTVLTGLIAEYMVDSIDGLAATGGISKEFIALILLPIVGNAAEHLTAVVCSYKDKLDLSMAVAVGSSIQISLFVLPFLILLGWAVGQPLTLQFDVLEVICLFISILIVNNAIADGRANWMEGLSLIMAYVIIALVFFFYPGSDIDGTILTR